MTFQFANTQDLEVASILRRLDHSIVYCQGTHSFLRASNGLRVA